MAFVGKVFGKAKRRGADVGSVREEGEGALLAEPEFEMEDAGAFWSWFTDNAARANQLNRSLQDGGDPEGLVRPLFNALQRFDGRLSLLIGRNENHESELVISADGALDAFAAVTKLVAAAPRIENWRITAFKPRIDGMGQITVNGKDVGPQTTTYMSEMDRAHSTLSVSISLPWLGQIPDDAQKQIAYLLLDNLLGEYDATTSISNVDVSMRADREGPSGKSLFELAAEVDVMNANRARH